MEPAGAAASFSEVFAAAACEEDAAVPSTFGEGSCLGHPSIALPSAGLLESTVLEFSERLLDVLDCLILPTSSVPRNSSHGLSLFLGISGGGGGDGGGGGGGGAVQIIFGEGGGNISGAVGDCVSCK